MDPYNSIILGCPACGMSFFIEALTEDGDGNIPNPLFCPFCSNNKIEEGFCIPTCEDDEWFSEEETETLQQDHTRNGPSLILLPGGRDGEQDDKRKRCAIRQNRNPNNGSPEQGEGIRQDNRPRHPYER